MEYPVFKAIDLHIHTTFSDGTDSPEEILNKVRDSGIGCFSVTDHDSVKAGTVIPQLLSEDDPCFIPGVEFSSKDEYGKYHILGYGIDPLHEAIRSVVEHGHSLRMKKLIRRLECLKSEFGFGFPDSEIEKLISLDNPGKPHIGQLMVKYGYAETKDEAISRYLNRSSFAGEHIRPEEAIKGILGAGGIPVLAHPFYGSGGERIEGDDMEYRLRRLVEYGLKGIESFYPGFSVEQRLFALVLADRYDLFVTAGSDFHGRNKQTELGKTGLNPDLPLPDRMRRFLEVLTEGFPQGLSG